MKISLLNDFLIFTHFQYNQAFTGRTAASDTMVCLEKRNRVNVIDVLSYVAIIIASVLVFLLLVLALLIILGIFWCLRRQRSKANAKIAPTVAAVAAPLGIVSFTAVYSIIMIVLLY